MGFYWSYMFYGLLLGTMVIMILSHKPLHVQTQRADL